MDKLSIAVLITCFNRREVTLTALRCLKEAISTKHNTEVFLVDDGSTDGTADAIVKEFPEVHLMKGDGNLYWNGGMRTAWQAALSKDFDFFLWLNDDLALRPGAVDKILEQWHRNAAQHSGKLIVAGKTSGETDKEATTYGVLTRASKLSRIRFRKLTSSEVYGDTFNGNCVLIPKVAARDVGILSEHFTHSAGDMDYGLRARRAGYSIMQSDIFVGEQENNGSYATPSSLSFRALHRFMTHPKGAPLNEWYHFCRSHAGWLWPINFVAMYIKPFLRNHKKVSA